MADGETPIIREEAEKARQRRFREEFIAAAPSWYRGEHQLAIVLGVPLATLAVCWWGIEAPTALEWAIVIPVVLFGNFFEWWAHRNILHKKVKGMELAFFRHAGVHHHFFTHHDMTFKGADEWRALLFPPYAPIAFILASVPPALVVGALWSANAAYIMVGMMAANYLLYEGLHTASHLSDERHPYLKHIPILNTVRRMHRAHHRLHYMQATNFNLTFPVADAVMGTSDLERGFFGTLLNGASEAHARRDVRLEHEPRDFTDWGTPESTYDGKQEAA